MPLTSFTWQISLGQNHGESTTEATKRPLVCHDVECKTANPLGDGCPARTKIKLVLVDVSRH
jgi:hypothetical protein